MTSLKRSPAARAIEAAAAYPRRLPIGAEVQPEGGVHWRVWAPRRKRVAVVLEGGPGQGQTHSLPAEASGYFAGLAADAGEGTLYRFRLDDDPTLYPDPVSRYQPDGPHGASQVVDPRSFAWTDARWPGVGLQGQVIYELHIGTFTPEGTWEAALQQLPELAALGITMLEVMPVAEFPGRFGWGYDGVSLFAPTRLYGTTDDMRRFIDQAHALGMGVILDVVYNHLGPDGNYLKQFAEHYFTDRHANEWGEALNFDDAESGPVREFFIANAEAWIKEYHLDGLRLDATQAIIDSSPDHILSAIARTVRQAGGERATFIVAENEPQECRLVQPTDRGGFGLDAIWNDDFHHSAMVALTGRNEAYYSDHQGKPQEFISALKWGFLFQGQWYRWQRKRRGTPSLHQDPARFVTFLQNHDQVANSGRGWRCQHLTAPGRLRAMTALLLLGPNTPMLFQGQEFASSSPFLFFADHQAELAKLVAKGRKEFLQQFGSLDTPTMQELLDDPAATDTFVRCKLNFSERERHAEVYQLHRDLIQLRREDPVFRAPKPRGVDGAVLNDEAFVLRFFGADGNDRLLFINLGRDLHLDPAPEPLLAPPEGKLWKVLWSSEDPRYGGCGTPAPDTEMNWFLLGQAALVMQPE